MRQKVHRAFRVILDTIRQRLRASLLRPAPVAADLRAAAAWATKLDDDGGWSDIDYVPDAARHLERTLFLAKAWQAGESELEPAVTRALDFWLLRDFPCTDDRCHRIEVPRLVGLIAFLTGAALSPGAHDKTVEILARSRLTHGSPGLGWSSRTGADLVSTAFNVVLRGCLENLPTLCEGAFRRVYAEIRVAPPGEDGLQADMSFHRGGPLLHSGADGLEFARHCAGMLALTHGTPWQASAECLRLFVASVLDGQQWMIRRETLDYSTLDREIARGPKSLAEFAAAVEHLNAATIPPRRTELAAFVRRLRGGLEGLSGHRHYWRSDFAVHQRPGFYTSVRMGSRRTLTAGCGGDEGKQSHHLADGLTYLLRDGGEYRDIFPVWDWQRLPGTTCVQSPAPPPPSETGRRGGGTFVGGVGDGEYGLAVMELDRDGLRARKAWFYFDDSFVCLGTDIACEREDAPVLTSVNQCLLRGPATAYGKGGETHVLAFGKPYDLSAARRLEHDGVMYHFHGSMAVCAILSSQTGSWAAIGTGSDEPVSKDVFSVWIDHGTQPRHETYAYTVVPAGGDPDARRRADHEIAQIEVLANTPGLQAVRHRTSRVVGLVFWQQGVIPLPGGNRVAANRPCVVLCQDQSPAGARLSIANPTNEAATVHVEYAGRCLCFDLPGGSKGGQSVTRVL